MIDLALALLPVVLLVVALAVDAVAVAITVASVLAVRVQPSRGTAIMSVFIAAACVLLTAALLYLTWAVAVWILR